MNTKCFQVIVNSYFFFNIFPPLISYIQLTFPLTAYLSVFKLFSFEYINKIFNSLTPELISSYKKAVFIFYFEEDVKLRVLMHIYINRCQGRGVKMLTKKRRFCLT